MRIRHLGYTHSLCGRGKNFGLIRPDLDTKRYQQLGIKERLKNEEPYRVCKICIKRSKEHYRYA